MLGADDQDAAEHNAGRKRMIHDSPPTAIVSAATVVENVIVAKPSSMTEAQLIEAVNAHHAEAEQAASTALTKAMAAGDVLIEAKRRCQHGEWGGWLDEHFAGSSRTARSYMRLANHRETIESKMAGSAVLSIDAATEALKAPEIDQDGLPCDFSHPHLPDWRGGQAYLGYHREHLPVMSPTVQIVPSPGSGDPRCCYVTVVGHEGPDGGAPVEYGCKPGALDHQILADAILAPSIRRQLSQWVWLPIDKPAIWYSDQQESLADSPIQVGTFLDNHVLKTGQPHEPRGGRS